MPISAQSFRNLCAVLDGDLRPETAATTLEDVRCARVLACTPDLPPWAPALAAARIRTPSLILCDVAADVNAGAAMMATLQRLPEEPARQTLWHLAATLPAGSFADHAATLLAWTHARRCNAEYAATLIGASPLSATLVASPHHASLAIRRWGASASHPTMWMQCIGEAEALRFVMLLERDSSHLAHALPFLPDPMRFLDRLVRERQLPTALDACLNAPPQAHIDALIDAILERASLQGLFFSTATLVRLAHRQRSAVAHLAQRLMHHPGKAGEVCAIVRWATLPDLVQAVIRDSADYSAVCRAILAARGEHAWTGERDRSDAHAFFAALDVNVWDRLAPDERAAWLRWLRDDAICFLACRALGHRAEALLHVPIRALEDAAAGLRACGLPPKSVRAALLPVACRGIETCDRSALLPHLERRAGDPLVFAQVVTGIALASPLNGDDNRPALRPSLADAIDALDLLRTDALQADIVHLGNSAGPLSATARALLRAAIPSDLLAPDARASLEARADALLLLLAAILHARRAANQKATQSAPHRALACATLVHPDIADLLAPTVHAAVADAEMAILGISAPRDTLALLMALDRLKDHPGDAQARQTPAAQQERLRWIAKVLAPNLRAAIAANLDSHSAACDSARRLR